MMSINPLLYVKYTENKIKSLTLYIPPRKKANEALHLSVSFWFWPERFFEGPKFLHLGTIGTGTR